VILRYLLRHLAYLCVLVFLTACNSTTSVTTTATVIPLATLMITTSDLVKVAGEGAPIPISGARVEIGDRTTKTDADGHFTLGSITRGTCLRIFADGYAPGEWLLNPPIPTIYELQPLNTVRTITPTPTHRDCSPPATQTPTADNPLSPEDNAAVTGKHIIVYLSQQKLYAYNGNALVTSMQVNAKGTMTGTFKVQNQLPLVNSVIAGWQLPYWLGIYFIGTTQNGIHGPEKLGNGEKAFNSLGCVVILTDDDALRLYKWASVGTPVIIR